MPCWRMGTSGQPATPPPPPWLHCRRSRWREHSFSSAPALSLKIHFDLLLGKLLEWDRAGTPQKTSASLPSLRSTPQCPGQTAKTRDVTWLTQGHNVCHMAVSEPEPRSLPGLVTSALSPLPGVPALLVLALETFTARNTAEVRHGIRGSGKDAWHSDGRE